MVSAGCWASARGADQTVRILVAPLGPGADKADGDGGLFLQHPTHSPRLQQRAGTCPGTSECQAPVPDSYPCAGTEATPAPRSPRDKWPVWGPDRGHDKNKCPSVWVGYKPFCSCLGAVRSEGFPTCHHLDPRTTPGDGSIPLGGWAGNGRSRLLCTRHDPHRMRGRRTRATPWRPCPHGPRPVLLGPQRTLWGQHLRGWPSRPHSTPWSAHT